MSVNFDIKLNWKDLFRFNLYQSYVGFQGVVAILMPVIIFVIAGITLSQGVYGYGLLYILGGIVVLLYLPFTLYARAKNTMKKNAVLANTLHYKVDEHSIGVEQGGETGELPWEHVYKMVSTKHLIMVYSSRVNAYLIPVEQLGEKYSALKKIAEKQLPKYRVRLR